MTEYAYSRKDPCISVETSTSSMRSSAAGEESVGTAGMAIWPRVTAAVGAVGKGLPPVCETGPDVPQPTRGPAPRRAPHRCRATGGRRPGWDLGLVRAGPQLHRLRDRRAGRSPPTPARGPCAVPVL